MLYGLESASMRKRQEAERQVAQLKMLMFSLGEKRMDRISSEYVRGTARVICLGDKVRQVRLRWFGHVHRRDDDCIGRRTLRLELKESPKMPHNSMFSRKVLFSFGHIWDILFQLFFIRLHTDITWTTGGHSKDSMRNISVSVDGGEGVCLSILPAQSDRAGTVNTDQALESDSDAI